MALTQSLLNQSVVAKRNDARRTGIRQVACRHSQAKKINCYFFRDWGREREPEGGVGEGEQIAGWKK